MRNKLIDQYGSYKQMSFIGPNGKWTLIGTRSTSDAPNSVMLSIDTFKGDNGKVHEMQRKEVDRLMEEGKIWV